MLEQLEKDDLESLASSQKIGARDTLIKETVTSMTTVGEMFTVEIR